MGCCQEGWPGPVSWSGTIGPFSRKVRGGRRNRLTRMVEVLTRCGGRWALLRADLKGPQGSHPLRLMAVLRLRPEAIRSCWQMHNIPIRF